MKKFVVSLLCIVFASASFAGTLTLEDLLDNIQANQSKIQDMYAETTTTITSNMVMPGSQSKGSQKMVQKGRMWTKGKDKSKIEILSPMKQTTITNGDKMAIINPESGQKTVSDLTKMRGQGLGGRGQGEMDLEKALEYFDLSVKKLDASELYPDSHIGAGSLETYVIIGVPKKANKFLGKMEFYVDSARWVPVKILMYGAKNKILSRSVIEYGKISKIWVPVKNKSNVNTPMGRMEVEMEFENIKVNEGIDDNVFDIN